MSRTHIRTSTSGDIANTRPHSTIEDAIADQHGEQIASDESNHLDPGIIEAVKSPSPLRKSFEPPVEKQAKLSRDNLKSHIARGQVPARQRFSMLRFRHASDPQISKTARDQSFAARPPMPAGKLWCNIRRN